MRSAIIMSQSESPRPTQGLGRFPDGHAAQLGDRIAVDEARKRQWAQPGATARRAIDLAHVPLDLLPLAVGLGLGVATPQIGDNTLEGCVVGALTPVPVLVLNGDLLRRPTLEQQTPLLQAELGPREIGGDSVLVTDRFDQATEIATAIAGPRMDRTVVDRQAGVGNNQFGIDLVRGAKTVAGRAGSVRRVEAEVAWREFLEALAV